MSSGSVSQWIDQLKGGADFATLAKEKSKDPGAAEGGDLGYFTKDQMVPEFADVAFKMYPGQLSNPVKTQFGWHVIKVEDRRTKQPPEFDKVKDQIEAFFDRSDEAVDLLQEARDLYREVNDPGGEADVLRALGVIALAHAESEKARYLFDEALGLFRKTDDILRPPPIRRPLNVAGTA